MDDIKIGHVGMGVATVMFLCFLAILLGDATKIEALRTTLGGIGVGVLTVIYRIAFK